MGCPESPTTDSVILLLPLCLVFCLFGFVFWVPPIFPCTEVLEALMRPSKGIPTAKFRG